MTRLNHQGGRLMPGKRITPQQEKIYMHSRSQHERQETAAARAGISVTGLSY